ncbi:hypothetical protein C8R42DRAFT_724646 [Lentinula raphanica]|nr:hypothetical protein C8R42DRAFT_724646 [Lentinula raphanica]
MSNEQDAPSSSFVYPIKSLLGNIQPAPDVHSSSSGSSTSPDLSRSVTMDIGSKSPPLTSPEINDVVVSVASSSRSDAANRKSFTKRRNKRSQSSILISDSPQFSRQNQKWIEQQTGKAPNFSHFPAGEDSNAESPVPRFYTSTSPSPTTSPSGSPIFSTTMLNSGEPPPPSPQEYNSRHPPALPVVAQQSFTSMSDSLLPSTSTPAPQWNPSELGIVHLASIPSLRETSTNGSERSSLRSPQSTSGSKSESSSNTSSKFSKYHTPEELSSGDDSKDSSGKPASKSSSDGDGRAPYSGEVSVRSQDSDAPRVSVRFQYMRDEHGNHVITGREGKLTRCEDEPIRTPRAVQGLGVLIVVEEVEDALVVRQVSENSTELLGLPPRYLFKLECFTDVLPESQASLLWDNVQYLSEPPETGDNTADDELKRGTLDIFLLFGYGAPGTVIPGLPVPSDPYDPWGVHEGKWRWTCWCAIHRPQPSPYLSNNKPKTHKSLIVMEFELKSYFFNPLYQTPNSATPSTSAPSGIESPDSIGSGSSGSLSSASASGSSGSGGTQTGNSTDASTNRLVSNPTSSADVSLNESSGSNSDSSIATLRNLSDSEITPPTLSSADSTQLLFEETDSLGPLHSGHSLDGQLVPVYGLEGDPGWTPSTEDIIESTMTRSKPLLALERLRRMSRLPGAPDNDSSKASPNGAGPSSGNGNVSMMDVFAVMTQINEQLGDAPDLDGFLKVTGGCNQGFDAVSSGLHSPAGDIPAQARELYKLNKVRILYDRDQPTARIVVRNREDLEEPLNMTHCYLRAMSPIHIKYLGNMGVRAFMSVSIMAFGSLWGLVAHSYGQHGMRVSFPVRQMLRLLNQSISRNIERLSYAQRLHTRKLINTVSSDNHPTGHIVSNADDLLGLFDADFGILVIGDGAKILGPKQHGQEIQIMAEYLRLNTIQVSQAVTKDFPDLNLSTGLEVIAGLLCVPLSSGGKDFIALLRKGQPRDVRWAGKPAWTDEQLETAGALALVYGKFIEVWRQKESALQTTKLTNLLLSNASHEVRTPLNHIINYLEMALNGSLDFETRDNLNRSHTASKNLLFTINDLLELTRLESGNETSLNEPFNLAEGIQDAISIYRNEAYRRLTILPPTLNPVKYTMKGKIAVRCIPFGEPEGLRGPSSTAMEIVVADTGCGIPPVKLESIFREINQVESFEPKNSVEPGAVDRRRPRYEYPPQWNVCELDFSVRSSLGQLLDIVGESKRAELNAWLPGYVVTTHIALASRS